MGAEALPAIFLTNDDADEGTAAERNDLNMSLPYPVSLQTGVYICNSSKDVLR